MTKMVFTMFFNENGYMVDAGNVTAPSYEEAKSFVISEGFNEKDFVLVKIEERPI